MFEQIQSDIYTQNSCAHDEIVSPSSDHNVKIEQPLEKPTVIRLLPSLFTILGVIWKTQGQLRWLKVELSEDQNLENCQQCITLLIFLEKQLNIVFEQNLGTRVNAVRNQSVGNLVIYNLKEEDVRIDPDLKKIFGVGEKHGTGTYIKRLNSPASYFIAMAKMENLHDGKPSKLLAKFSIREAPMKDSTTLLSTSCVTWRRQRGRASAQFDNFCERSKWRLVLFQRFSFANGTGNQLIKYTISSENVLPRAPPKQFYLELQQDNFRLSGICEIGKEISNEFQKIQKSTNRHALNCRRFGLSLDHWRRLEP